MSVEILTKEDLQAFRIQLLNDIKALLFIKQSANMEWLRSSEIRKALKISAGTLQNLRVSGKLKPAKIGGILFIETVILKNYWILVTKIQKESSTMLPTDIFEALYNTLLNDKRLSVCHCSIYMALILLWHKNELTNPFPVSRKGIMELAHVHSIVTYHKCIVQLEAYGYIRYNPSYSYYNRSTIYLDNVFK